MLEIYSENHWEIFDPQNGKQVAMFFDGDDAQAYLDWRNRETVLAEETSESVPDVDTDVGIGLLIDRDGALSISYDNGPEIMSVRVSDTEAQNLAAMIDAVLA